MSFKGLVNKCECAILDETNLCVVGMALHNVRTTSNLKAQQKGVIWF